MLQAAEAKGEVTPEWTDEILVSMKGIVKQYRVGGEISTVLKGIDLTVRKGEFLAILGPSGSGKSTLMNIIGCLDVPTKGEYLLSGIQISDQDEKTLAHIRNKQIGFIFQSFFLMQRQTALENVKMPLMYGGVPDKEQDERALHMLERVGLGEKVSYFPNQMSGGQQQRVGVARALVVNPEIIFADEPTGNLDSNTSKEVMELMQKVVREQKQTLVMVTHDNYLASFADRIFHIIDGKIVKIEDNRQKIQENA